MQVKDYAQAMTSSFALPDACTRIKELLDDDSSTAEDIANVIALDPSLTSKLLKLANSALYNFSSKIDTISRAVNVIGGRALYSLVMTEAASSAFKQFENNAIDLERFWQQSVFAALIAKHLASVKKIRDIERFFLLGLLHNIGELTVAVQSPEKATSCENFDKLLPWQQQQQVLDFTYAECSAEILIQWQLPSTLYTPIALQHNLNQASQNVDYGVLYMAARLSLYLVYEDKWEIDDLVDAELLACYDLDHKQLEECLQTTRDEAIGVLAIMNPDMFIVP